MFESDDFDQVLSQFDFVEVIPKDTEEENKVRSSEVTSNITVVNNVESLVSNPSTVGSSDRMNSPKHAKRKMINSHFNHKTKRKFPGPAGLLTGNLQEDKDENICHMELLSQDIDYTQYNLRKDLFDSPIWVALLDNMKSWNIADVDLINSVKQQAMIGNLRRRKAHVIAAFIETVDRSVTDPLIMLRDSTGTIKCTLHRDAWSNFAPYIVAEYCALVLWKPTVLTGSAFKKHYLNITLSNILAIYSSALLTENEKELPNGYSIVYKDDFTVIKTESYLQNTASNTSINNTDTGGNNIFEDLDSMFSDELF